MKAIELIRTAKFVVDSRGKKKAVLLDYGAWEELLALVEDREDTEEINRLREIGEDAIPWEQAKAELRDKGIDV